tara:strand:+ start:60 stop:332 length:273 start_codon:yes stop_codon:yes gene_type:complete
MIYNDNKQKRHTMPTAAAYAQHANCLRKSWNEVALPTAACGTAGGKPVAVACGVPGCAAVAVAALASTDPALLSPLSAPAGRHLAISASI